MISTPSICCSQTSDRLKFPTLPFFERIMVNYLLIICLLITYGCAQPEKKGIGDVYIPEVLTFAGDTIPIQDPDIRERLEKEILINQHGLGQCPCRLNHYIVEVRRVGGCLADERDSID